MRWPWRKDPPDELAPGTDPKLVTENPPPDQKDGPHIARTRGV